MANVFSLKKLQNKPSRNGFDLSRKNVFSAKVGELLPVACIECIPGDKFNIETQHFTRTRPVNTAAFTRIREYYDWFFVPTNLLWNKFNSFVTQMTDNGQHAQNHKLNYPLLMQHPYFTVNSVNHYISSMSQSGDSRNNIFGFNRGKQTAKLLEYLGYGDFYPTAYGDQDTVDLTNAVLNPFPLLAYQKIYFDYFRDSQWEKSYAPAFNIDYITGTSDGGLVIAANDIVALNNSYETMFDLRYANWNKDYFMGLKPSTQYGTAASTVLGGADLFTTANGSIPSAGTGVVIGSDYANGFFLNASTNTHADARIEVNSKFTILALRQAEAKQKWAEITQSQQQDYKSQVEAHFNVNVSDAYSERCKYIDGAVNNLDISEVLNTNITSTNEASIAGKGVGVGDSKTEFSTDVHGYLMCIYHAVPLLDYSTSGIERMNLKSYATDYAIPEFDRTGMVSVPRIELVNNVLTSQSAANVEILGYAPRYYDYKSSFDRIRGAFRRGADGFADWVAPLDNYFFANYLSAISGRLDVYNNSLNYHFFKVNPSVLNPIFDVDADSDLATDQLLVNTSFDIKAVRNLDYDGLPY